MTEKQTRIAIAIVIALVVLWFLLRGTKLGQAIAQDIIPSQPNVTLPNSTLPDRSITVNIPGLPSFSPYAYSPISPCMCNGSALSMPQTNGPLVTFVTNEGGTGGNVYNYNSGGSSGYSGLGSLTGVYTG